MNAVITELWIYPVKSLRGIPLQSARLELHGLEHDRRFMVVDAGGRFISQREVAGMALVGVTLTDRGVELTAPPQFSGERIEVDVADAGAPNLTVSVWDDTLDATAAWPNADKALSRWLGVACRLVYMTDPQTARQVDQDYGEAEDRVSFADGFPLLVANQSSLDAVRAFPNCSDVEMNRFRPNIVLSGDTPWDEDHWTTLETGGVTMRVVKPCARCVITTIDQATGERSALNEPLRSLAKFHRDKRGRIIFGQNVIPDGVADLSVGDPVAVTIKTR